MQPHAPTELEIYRHRFSDSEIEVREAVWKILCSDFLQAFVSETDTVIEVGAGDGLFIRNIHAGRRIAVDVAAHAQLHGTSDVEVHLLPATDLASRFRNQADVIFMSNFLEHLPDKRAVLSVLEQCRFCLKPAGRLLVLQPNIRYVGAAHWDYIDHHVARTERSLVEALELNGFEVKRLIRRFLPYTVKSRVGRLANLLRPALLIRAYLKLPFLWRVFGGQTFVEAQRADTTGQHERITSEGNSG